MGAGEALPLRAGGGAPLSILAGVQKVLGAPNTRKRVERDLATAPLGGYRATTRAAASLAAGASFEQLGRESHQHKAVGLSKLSELPRQIHQDIVLIPAVLTTRPIPPTNTLTINPRRDSDTPNNTAINT